MSDRFDRRLLEQDGKIAAIRKDVDFFVRTSAPPQEGILFEGQIFDAYFITSQLIRKAKKRIVLIDNYIDETVFLKLAKRNPGGRRLFSLMQFRGSSVLIKRSIILSMSALRFEHIKGHMIVS